MIVWSRWWVAGAVVVLALAGCGDDSPGPVLPPLPSSGSPSVSASPSPSAKPTGTAEEQILVQYRRFWTEAYPRTFAASAAKRRDILSPVTTEMLLSELLRVAKELDDAGHVSSGAPVLLDQAVTREGREAVVFGCLDMSSVVVTEPSTGKVVYRGGKRDARLTYMKPGADGVWRAYGLEDPSESPC